MFGFKKDPTKKLKTKIEKLYAEAMHFQRNGKLREYGEKMTEISDLEKEVETLESATAPGS